MVGVLKTRYLAQTLFSWRTKKNLTQEQLETKSGVLQQTISGIENGEATRPNTLHRLAKGLADNKKEMDMILDDLIHAYTKDKYDSNSG
jgi:transcriptional regulator with XRE-family HTH domain